MTAEPKQDYKEKISSSYFLSRKLYLLAKYPACHQLLLEQLDHLKLERLLPDTEQDMAVDSAPKTQQLITEIFPDSDNHLDDIDGGDGSHEYIN